MGPNLMRRRGRNRVIHTAIAGTSTRLAGPAVAALLAGLTPGDPFGVHPQAGSACDQPGDDCR
jgi:hypothetical protein